MIVFFSIVLAVALLGLVLTMLLKRQLREKYAVLWIVVGLLVLILGVFPGLLEWATRILGVQVPSNLLFALSIILLLGVSLHLSWELSQAEEEIRRTAEESAISRAEIDQLRERVGRLESQSEPEDSGSAADQGEAG